MRGGTRQGHECCGEHTRRGEAYRETKETDAGRLIHKARPDGSRGPETAQDALRGAAVVTMARFP